MNCTMKRKNVWVNYICRPNPPPPPCAPPKNFCNLKYTHARGICAFNNQLAVRQTYDWKLPNRYREFVCLCISIPLTGRHSYCCNWSTLSIEYVLLSRFRSLGGPFKIIRGLIWVPSNEKEKSYRERGVWTLNISKRTPTLNQKKPTCPSTGKARVCRGVRTLHVFPCYKNSKRTR